jgi:hypothetical protein
MIHSRNTEEYEKEKTDKSFSTTCTKCNVWLVGKEQYIGHMVCSHEVPYENMKMLWDNLSKRLKNIEFSMADDIAHTVN